MVYRGLEPSVHAVVESYKRSATVVPSLRAPKGHQIDEAVTFLVNEDDELDFLIEAGVEAFWLLSEDEQTYELVQFPITEGIGGFLGGMLRGVKGMFNWLRTDAFDWLSRRLPGGNARQIAKLYAQDPEKARDIVKQGLGKQFQGPALDEQMRTFDAKMSRQQAMRTNAIQTLNQVRQNPNDPQARGHLQAIGDAYGAIQRAQQDAQASGQDPHAAASAAAKTSLGSLIQKGMHHLAGTPHLAPSQAAGAHSGAKPTAQKPATPAQPNQMPSGPSNGFKVGDAVSAQDKNGQPITGKIVQNPLYAPPKNNEPHMVQLSDGSHMGMNAAQWKNGAGAQQQQPGAAAAQPAAQPAPGPASATGSPAAPKPAGAAPATPSAAKPTGSPAAAPTGNPPGSPAAPAGANPQAAVQHGAASPSPQQVAPAPGSNAPQQQPPAAASAAATTPPNTAAPVNPSQAKPAAPAAGATPPQAPMAPPVQKAPPAKKGQVNVQNRKSYQVTVMGQPQTQQPGAGGASTRFASVMTGAQLMRAIGNAASDGVINTKEHGPIMATKVMVTDPSTQTTMTIAIKKGQQPKVEPTPGQPPQPKPPTQPPAAPQQGQQP